MIDFINTWTKENFKLYLYIYASQANLFESEEEIELIRSKFKNDEIEKIHKQVKNLNDYYRCQIIIEYIKKQSYTQLELDNIINEIKTVFDSDGEFCMLEQQSMYMLEKLLRV